MRILKNIVSVFVLLTLGLQTNYQLSYYILFSINQTELIKSLCEETRPACNACCYLEKQMDQETEGLPAEPVQRNGKKGYELKISEFVVSGKGGTVSNSKGNSFHIFDFIFSKDFFVKEIFHPPSIAS